MLDNILPCLQACSESHASRRHGGSCCCECSPEESRWSLQHSHLSSQRKDNPLQRTESSFAAVENNIYLFKFIAQERNSPWLPPPKLCSKLKTCKMSCENEHAFFYAGFLFICKQSNIDFPKV